MGSLAIKPKQLVRALERAGFYVHHQTGSHVRMLHRTKSNLKVTVPIHSKDIPLGTLHKILKQAGLTKEEFIGLTR